MSDQPSRRRAVAPPSLGSLIRNTVADSDESVTEFSCPPTSVQLSLGSASRDSWKRTCKCWAAPHVGANRPETTRYPTLVRKSRLSKLTTPYLPGRGSPSAQTVQRSRFLPVAGSRVVSHVVTSIEPGRTPRAVLEVKHRTCRRPRPPCPCRSAAQASGASGREGAPGEMPPGVDIGAGGAPGSRFSRPGGGHPGRRLPGGPPVLAPAVERPWT